jgi:NAD(P)-dependent dehydrogenase (short-subunit alcohol dehydrogenase family)
MKTALITGVTSGIGRASTFKLAEMSFDTLVLIARNSEKLLAVKDELLAKYPKLTIILKVCDLADFDQVKKTALELKGELKESGIDLLLNNAGIGQFERTENKQGFENNLATNYLSQVILTEHLLENLNQNSSVIFVSSMAYQGANVDYGDINLKQGFSMFRAYGNSKAYQMVYSRQLQKRFENDGRDLSFESVHPGVVKTSWGRGDSNVFLKFLFKLGSVFMITPEYSVSHNVLAPIYELNKTSLGKSDIWMDGKPKIVGSSFMKEENKTKLWEFTQKSLEKWLK